MPQRWTEQEVRAIAQDAAIDVMPVGTADAGAVDEAINDLRRQNEALSNLVEAQGHQIDVLNDAYRAQEEYMEGFVANYNRHTH